MKKIKKIAILVMMLVLCLYTTGCEEVRAASASMDLSDIMTYTGEPYIVVNDNVPFFEESDYTTEAFESYSPLDSIGRCGTAFASI